MSNKQSIFDKIKSNKKIQFIIVAALCLIIIVVFACNLFTNKNTLNSSTVSESYVKELEERLTKTLNKVEGAGKVSVVITVESGMETVIAMKTTVTETANGKETVETPVLVNGKTVVLKEKYPKITGVLIVAEGADSIRLLSKIQQATMSLLDINIQQIEILTMK